MAKKKPKAKDGSEVLYLRIDPELASWLGDLSEKTGRSRNDLAASALEEFREIMGVVGKLERQSDCDPSLFLRVLGPSWLARLVTMQIASDRMKESWRVCLSEMDERRFAESSDRARLEQQREVVK